MALVVTCKCSASYELKDEFAGQLVQCQRCSATIRAPVRPLVPQSNADPAFNRDVFLLRQKAMAINEKYHVFDEQGKPIVFVERPRHFLRNFGALLAGLTAGVATIMAFDAISALLEPGTAQDVLVLVGIVAFLVVFFFVLVLLWKKRHVTFYRDDTKGERLLEVRDEQKFVLFVARYTIRDAKGRPLGRLRKNHLYDILRKRWELRALNGTTICVAREDSIILSLLRRFLGSLYGLLRTNFVLLRGGTDHLLGEFKRKITILDRYVLDLTPDANRTLDRRLALALGVMLDSGERR